MGRGGFKIWEGVDCENSAVRKFLKKLEFQISQSSLVNCIQYTLSSRAALGLLAACSAFRPSASREEMYLAYKLVKTRNYNISNTS